jgi:Family of unknown function (DUF6428)
MKTSEFKQVLERYPESSLAFILPSGKFLPAHAHITEVGRVDKIFLDCGGETHKISACSLQAWVADDMDHRLNAGKLAAILEEADPILSGDDPVVEIEFEQELISQFPVVEAEGNDKVITFRLTTKHTDCLAKDVCLPKDSVTECCAVGSGCC